jgi:hypothetical protein
MIFDLGIILTGSKGEKEEKNGNADSFQTRIRILATKRPSLQRIPYPMEVPIRRRFPRPAAVGCHKTAAVSNDGAKLAAD